MAVGVAYFAHVIPLLLRLTGWHAPKITLCGIMATIGGFLLIEVLFVIAWRRVAYHDQTDQQATGDETALN